MNRTHDAFMEQFKSLETTLGEFRHDPATVAKAAKTVRRAFWSIVIINLVLGLVGTAMTVGVIGIVTLGLLKLFGVI